MSASNSERDRVDDSLRKGWRTWMLELLEEYRHLRTASWACTYVSIAIRERLYDLGGLAGRW